MRQELHTVADAQYRNTEIEIGLINERRAAVVDARRPAGKDQALGPECFHLIEPSVIRKYLAIDLRFANAPCNELCILGAEIEDQDSFTVDIGHDELLSKRKK
jgi:hypothetical protein